MKEKYIYMVKLSGNVFKMDHLVACWYNRSPIYISYSEMQTVLYIVKFNSVVCTQMSEWT